MESWMEVILLRNLQHHSPLVAWFILLNFKDALYNKFCIVFIFNEGNSTVITIHPIDTALLCVILQSHSKAYNSY